VVTICTTSWTFNSSTFSPHSVFVCFVWLSEQTAIISLYNINWLVFYNPDGVFLLRGTDWVFKWNSGQYESSKALPWLRRSVAGLSPWRTRFNPRPFHVRFVADVMSPTLIWFSHNNSCFLFSAVPYQVIQLACQTDSRPIVPLFAALLMCVDRDCVVIWWRHNIYVPTRGHRASSLNSQEGVGRQSYGFAPNIHMQTEQNGGARWPGEEDDPLISCLGPSLFQRRSGWLFHWCSSLSTPSAEFTQRLNL